jgi:hypothetical protein
VRPRDLRRRGPTLGKVAADLPQLATPVARRRSSETLLERERYELSARSAHGEHHRHYMGKTEAIEIGSYEQALYRFQTEWQELVKTLKRPKVSKPKRGKRS